LGVETELLRQSAT